MWDLVQDKVMADYLQAFQKRCADIRDKKSS